MSRDDDELSLPRAIRNLRNHLRAVLSLLDVSPALHRGWWDSIKAEERMVVRAFSELRAEQPTDPGPTVLIQPAILRRDDPWGDEDE